MTDLPTVLTKSGLQPQTPDDIRTQLLASVSATNPGYTATLPGSLIEDISSTDVGAILLCDAARVELVNSLTPYGANAFLLNQLGQMIGVYPGDAVNTSVSVVFSGPPGYVVVKGFTVSDGTYQYVAQDGAAIGSGGSSDPVYCVATQSGSWVVPAGTVQQLVTSVPTGLSPPLTCNNPTAGTSATSAESEASYRVAVLQAERASSQGMATYLKTLLGNVSGVQRRLISVLQQTGGGWEVIVGGGDPYKVAYAIYYSLFDISTLVGSTLLVTNVSSSNPGVVTTNLNHGYATGQQVQLNGIVGPTALNGATFTATVVDEKRFSIGVNTATMPPYVSGGVATPNLRNISPSLVDYPNTYVVPIVVPPQQLVTMTVTWNTTATLAVSNSSMQQLASPALIAYVNSLYAGQPMNVFAMDKVFQEAVSSVLDTSLLTRLVFSVSINGIGTPPDAGTGIIQGDPESYFEALSNAITVQQG